MSDKITKTAQTVLEKRYFLKDKDGNPYEHTWNEVSNRNAICFGKDATEVGDFAATMNALDFLPNSPALMNAGTEITSYSACFVLPVGDSIDDIFGFYHNAALISKSGGGVGANFSGLRPSGSIVGSTGGVASGPISFMEGQNALTEVIKQGGKRRGANMGILMCDHPDILDFIRVKDTPGVLENFNLSVGITDEFMESVLQTDTDLSHGKAKTSTDNEKLWNELMERAHSSGEPGILFMDTIEKGNNTPHLGKLEATNPCGEQPLLPFENCDLGSINLSNMVITRKDEPDYFDGTVIDWTKLSATVKTATLFLNRIIDASELPIPECQEAMLKTRKIGLGIMGLHDMLIQLDLLYDSEEGRRVAGEVMKFIASEADSFSVSLGEDEGCYAGLYTGSEDPMTREPDQWYGHPVRRNANLTTIAPTGTLSMIADCSSGCEPYYAPVTVKSVLDGEDFIMPNKWFLKAVEEYCEKNGADKDMALKNVADRGIMNAEVPKEIQNLFKGAEDIHWSDHIKMQAELQKYVDSSISKTINMPNDATVKDVKDAYELAYELGCKGITIYRDGSRDSQVLSSGVESNDNPGEHDNSDDGSNDCGCRGSEECLGHADQDDHPDEGGTRDTVDSFEDWPVPYKIDLPDVLASKRYRVRDHGGSKVYFNVCTMDDRPVEVFARLAEEKPDSYWNTICRLTSLCLRYGIPLDDITKQLRKSSSSVADTPAKLARILDKYKHREATATESVAAVEALSDGLRGVDYKIGANIAKRFSQKILEQYKLNEEINGKSLRDKADCCPECGSLTQPGGGCETCPDCGWEKCS